MAAQQQERLEVPAGGIADFAKTDEEIAELEALEAQEDFGNAGIANFSEVAGRMAGYGRFGDDSVAHVKTGEIIVPKELIDNNPRLKEQIFAELMEAGIEDPEQYVVGSSANRINPDTGLPEFGFFSKLWKKLKKAVKKVIGVVLPIVLSMTPLGPLGAALGSGIATLVQGGDLKDAFKSAALAGLTSFAMSKIAPKFAGKSTEVPVEPGAVDPSTTTAEALDTGIAPPSEVVADSLAGEQIAGATRDASIRDALRADIGPSIATDLTTLPGYVPAESIPTQNVSAQLMTGDVQGGGFTPTTPQNNVLGAGPQEVIVDRAAGIGDALRADTIRGTNLSPTFGERIFSKVTDPVRRIRSGESTIADEWFRGGESKAEVRNRLQREAAAAGNEAVTNAQAEAAATGKTLTQGQIDAAYRTAYSAAPTQLPLMTRYGPTAALGVGALALSGGFKTPEQEDIGIIERDEFGNPITGETYIRRDPGKYLVSELGYLRLNPETGEYEDIRDQEDDENTSMIASSMMRENPYLDFPQYGNPPVNVARGGAMYPRRTGGIMPYEGTPNEDSVRALLMPGEFVMTTDAVRGAGNGNLNQGINNMYGIMRNLERVGRVA